MASRATEGRITRYTVIKVRLYPTPEQAAQMEQTFGCCRWLWNRMLTDAREFYAATDLQYIPAPARYKKEAPFLREADSQALCAVHQSLRQAFLDFFRNPAAFRAPRFKTKKARKDSFTTPCRRLPSGPTVYLTGEAVRLPKLGPVRANLHRKPLHWWTLVSATVSRTRSGKYFCSLSFRCSAEEPEKIPPENTLTLRPAPGRFYVDDRGNSPDPPRWLDQSRERLARMQRKLARMERGSGNCREQLRKIRLLHERIANQRRDFIHKESRRIANAWDAVAVEDAGGAADPGFGRFRDCLRYKLERQGKTLITLVPAEAG